MANTNSFNIELPSSGYAINFRTPVWRDRSKVLKHYEGKEAGYMAEDAIAILCIESINGERVDPDLDPETFLGSMELSDYNYYFDIFSAMFFSDLKKRESAQDVAKKLLSGEPIVGTRKNAPATVSAGKSVA